MEEKKLTEVIETMEKKQNTLLESMAVVLNYLLAVSVREKPEDAKQEEEITHRMQTLLIFRDECMEAVHGEEYTKHMNEANKELVKDIMKDILGNILK